MHWWQESTYLGYYCKHNFNYNCFINAWTGLVQRKKLSKEGTQFVVNGPLGRIDKGQKLRGSKVKLKKAKV